MNAPTPGMNMKMLGMNVFNPRYEHENVGYGRLQPPGMKVKMLGMNVFNPRYGHENVGYERLQPPVWT
jgi:hypothetical protein